DDSIPERPEMLFVGVRNAKNATITNSSVSYGEIDDNETGLAVARVAVSTTGGCGLLTDGTVRCWGQSDEGRLGWGYGLVGVTPSTMGDNLIPVNVGVGRTVTQVASAKNSTCALL